MKLIGELGKDQLLTDTEGCVHAGLKTSWVQSTRMHSTCLGGTRNSILSVGSLRVNSDLGNMMYPDDVCGNTKPPPWAHARGTR